MELIKKYIYEIYKENNFTKAAQKIFSRHLGSAFRMLYCTSAFHLTRLAFGRILYVCREDVKRQAGEDHHENEQK